MTHILFEGDWKVVACVVALSPVFIWYSKRGIISCWFCHHKMKLHSSQKSGWFCPSCEQYNGFNEQGDYNRPIPAFTNASLNKPANLVTRRPWPTPPEILCAVCTHNQRLKIQQRNVFDSKNEDEIDHFEKMLEGTYRLCPRCQQAVREEVQRKDRQTIAHAIGRPRRNYDLVLHHPISETISWTLFLLLLFLPMLLLDGPLVASPSFAGYEVFLVCTWLVDYLVLQYIDPAPRYPFTNAALIMGYVAFLGIGEWILPYFAEGNLILKGMAFLQNRWLLALPYCAVLYFMFSPRQTRANLMYKHQPQANKSPGRSNVTDEGGLDAKIARLSF